MGSRVAKSGRVCTSLANGGRGSDADRTALGDGRRARFTLAQRQRVHADSCAPQARPAVALSSDGAVTCALSAKARPAIAVLHSAPRGQHITYTCAHVKGVRRTEPSKRPGAGVSFYSPLPGGDAPTQRHAGAAGGGLDGNTRTVCLRVCKVRVGSCPII